MRRSFATLSQEPRQGPRPTRHWLKRLLWRSRSHQDPASLEIIQSLFDRLLPLTLDSADLSHRLSSIRNRDGPAFAHVPDDLRKPRLLLRSRVDQCHGLSVTGRTGSIKRIVCAIEPYGRGFATVERDNAESVASTSRYTFSRRPIAGSARESVQRQISPSRFIACGRAQGTNATEAARTSHGATMKGRAFHRWYGSTNLPCFRLWKIRTASY